MLCKSTTPAMRRGASLHGNNAIGVALAAPGNEHRRITLRGLAPHNRSRDRQDLDRCALARNSGERHADARQAHGRVSLIDDVLDRNGAGNIKGDPPARGSVFLVIEGSASKCVAERQHSRPQQF